MRKSLIAIPFVGFAMGVGFACASFDDATTPSSAEAGANDGAAAVDGEVDAAPQTFCASQGPNVYCRDFDDGGATEAWNATSVTAGVSALTLDGEEKVSPPFSLRARIEPGAPLCTYASAHRDLGVAPAKTTVSFDVRLGGADTRSSEGASYFVIKFDGCNLILSANESRGSAHAQLEPVNDDHGMVAAYPRPNVWTHVETTIDLATSNVEIFVDGALATDDGGFTLPAGCILPGSHLEIRPGMHCESASDAGREVHIDNILVTASE